MSTAEEPLKTIANIFGVLAHPDRLRILSLLKTTEMDVSHIQTEVGISQSGVSQHLTQLRQHGLVDQRRDGKHIFYRLKAPEIALLVATALQIMLADMATDGQLFNSVSDMLAVWGLK